MDVNGIQSAALHKSFEFLFFFRSGSEEVGVKHWQPQKWIGLKSIRLLLGCF